MTLPIHASVVVNFGSTSAYASVLGFASTFDSVGEPVDGVIVQLAAPLSDGSLAALVPRSSCAVLPPKAPRRGYDRSLSNTQKLLANGFAGASVAKNKVKDGDKLRVICADMQQADKAAAFLRSNGYSVTRHPTSRIEFTCTAGVVSETVDDSDSDNDSSDDRDADERNEGEVLS
jgi:rhodanese-related sulfurtransferase